MSGAPTADVNVVGRLVAAWGDKVPGVVVAIERDRCLVQFSWGDEYVSADDLHPREYPDLINV